MTTTINQSNFSFKHVATRVLSMFMLAIMLFTGVAETTVYADNELGITINSNGEVDFNVGDDGKDIWTKIGDELANVIAALSGIATVVMVGMCLFNMTKVATAGTNAKARTEALQAVGWTLLAAVGLGSVTLWVALAMNTGKEIEGKKTSSRTIEEVTTVASVELNTELAQLELTM